MCFIYHWWENRVEQSFWRANWFHASVRFLFFTFKIFIYLIEKQRERKKEKVPTNGREAEREVNFLLSKGLHPRTLGL